MIRTYSFQPVIDFDSYDDVKYKIENLNTVDVMLREQQRHFDQFVVLENVWYTDDELRFQVSSENNWGWENNLSEEVIKRFNEISFGHRQTFSNLLKYFIEAAEDIYNKFDIGIKLSDSIQFRADAIRQRYLERQEECIPTANILNH